MTSAGRHSPLAAAGAALLALLLLAGCASKPSWPTYPAIPDLAEVDLRWLPRPGMRLVHRMTTDVEASGPLTEAMAARDRKRRITHTRSVEVTEVTDDYFDFRVVRDGWPLPATLRFSRAWVPIEVRPDAGLGGQDHRTVDAALRQLAEPLTQSAQLFGRWRVGETRPFTLRLGAIPEATGAGQGETTFRGAVMLGGRRAAEFDWKGDLEFLLTGEPGRGVPGRMRVVGKEWRDLETGVSLRLMGRAETEFTRQGRATQVEYVTDEALDVEASRL